MISKQPRVNKIFIGVVAKIAIDASQNIIRQHEAMTRTNQMLKALALPVLSISELNDVITALEFEGVLESVVKKLKGQPVRFLKIKMSATDLRDCSQHILQA